MNVTNLIPDNTKEIALAKLLALTPFVGFIGTTVFAVSDFWVQTFEGLTRRSSARFVDHEVINGKQVTEFIGANLRELEFEIVLHSGLGVEPLSSYETLDAAVESGEPQRIFISGKNHKMWTIRNIEGKETHWAHGRPAVMEVTLSLREYVSSLPSIAERKLKDAKSKRKETGKGGPERLPGTGALEVPPVQLTPVGGAGGLVIR